MAKAKAAGQFLGGVLNNPFVAILLLGIGALLIFREPILKGFSSIGESFGKIDITLPEIKLPEINFPEFNFPDFPDFTNLFDQLFKNQASILAGQTVAGAEGDPVQIPPDTIVNPDGTVTSTTPPTTQTVTGDLSTFFGEQRPLVFDTLQDAFGLTPSQAFVALKNVTTIEGLNEVLQKFNQAAIDEEIKEAAPTNLLNAGGSIADQKVSSFLLDDPFKQFEGGGVSFVGGSIFETPIQNLSLSQIIDKFNVTASQAANLKAIAQGFTPEEEAFLQGSQDIGGFFTGFNPPAVSDPQFQGLTPQQIALMLTGGNISNF